MSQSINRVRRAAETAGLEIEVVRMGASTRTAAEAAQQCNCRVDQIVKSLVFQGEDTDELYLFLVRGSEQLDLEKAAGAAGETLKRADPRIVRERTGFAIGGVAPIGHQMPIRCFADKGLTKFDTVWAAAGAHDAVFSVAPERLISSAGAQIGDITTDQRP